MYKYYQDFMKAELLRYCFVYPYTFQENIKQGMNVIAI